MLTGGASLTGGAQHKESYIYEADESKWKLFTTLRKPISEHIACYWRKTVTIFGGREGSKLTNTVHVIELGGKEAPAAGVINTYSHLKHAPVARSQHCACVLPSRSGGGIFIFGGYGGHGKYFNDIHILQTGMRWEKPKVLGADLMALAGTTANLISDKVVLFGGHSKVTYSKALSICHYDPVMMSPNV